MVHLQPSISSLRPGGIIRRASATLVLSALAAGCSSGGPAGPETTWDGRSPSSKEGVLQPGATGLATASGVTVRLASGSSQATRIRVTETPGTSTTGAFPVGREVRIDGLQSVGDSAQVVMEIPMRATIGAGERALLEVVHLPDFSVRYVE